MHTYNFDVNTSFHYRNASSNFTLKVINFAPQYVPNITGSPVIVFVTIIVTGNLTSFLHPTRVVVELSDVGPYGNNNTFEIPTFALPLPPQSNVTVPSLTSIGQTAGNFSKQALFGLDNQKTGIDNYRFGLISEFEVNFLKFPHSDSIGNHILHMKATLQGPGFSDSLEINVLMTDTN